MSDRLLPLSAFLLGAISVLAIQKFVTSFYGNNSEGSTTLLKAKIGDVDAKDYPAEIKEELFSRVRTFFGDKEYENLGESFVIVVGLGGVGSHAANMLVRSGVAKIRLIDFDQVSLSSLNRHAVATMEDVGLSKAEVMRNKLLKVVPWCVIEAETEMFKKESASRLLRGNPCMVLDCIDDVSTKAELIAHCMQNDKKVLTSMGAGGKADPTRIRISALADCINDPLASKIKWKLKKHDVDPEKVMSIFSVEKPMCDLLPLDDEQKNNPQDYGVVDYIRLRVMPVLGTSPSIFGQAMASYVLCTLAGKMYDPEVCERMSKNLKHKMRQTFQSTEMRRFQTKEEIDLDDEDIEFVVQQMWRTRCAVSARKIGGHAPLILTRWYPDQLPVPYNLVLMQRPYAMLLEEGGHDALPLECRQRIEDRLRWAEHVCRGSWGQSNQTPTPARPSVGTAEAAQVNRSFSIPSLAIICMLLAAQNGVSGAP